MAAGIDDNVGGGVNDDVEDGCIIMDSDELEKAEALPISSCSFIEKESSENSSWSFVEKQTDKSYLAKMLDGRDQLSRKQWH